MRKTTAYLVRVPADVPNDVIPDLVRACPVPVEQTASHSGFAGLRFRIPTNDTAAMDIARQIAGGRSFTVSTGYGVHQRDIGRG